MIRAEYEWLDWIPISVAITRSKERWGDANKLENWPAQAMPMLYIKCLYENVKIDLDIDIGYADQIHITYDLERNGSTVRSFVYVDFESDDDKLIFELKYI